MAISELEWSVYGGRGKRMPDIETDDFYAELHYDRTWRISVKEDPEHPEPSSAAAWWSDYCDDRGRELVPGVLPHTVRVKMRSWALRSVMQIQKDYDRWVADGCPMEDA